MSIASEINRLSNAKQTIKTSLNNKGIAILDSATLDSYSTAIDNAVTVVDVKNDTVTADSVLSGKTAHINTGASVTGSIPTKTSSDMTVSDATVTAPAGYYATATSKTVASGIQGTPIATKGIVSNHSISITPSTTDTTGYITGSTKTGTAVTVSASELVSGTVTTTPKITSQNINVTNYATNTIDPIYKEISTSAGMDAVNIDANAGKMYKYTGTTDTKYTNGRLYIVEAST